MRRAIDKVMRADEALAAMESKRPFVFTNGCFDILHAGHVRYLEQARLLGNALVVGLNSDASVLRLKGEGRPVNPVEDRAEVLAALESVDCVVVFEEADPIALIQALKPDIHTKGGDYAAEALPEAEIVRSYGGRVVILPEVPGRSTSGVIKRIGGQP